MKGKSSSNRRGLLAGGNWIIDQVKLIDVYPQREQLANIRAQAAQGTGGAPYNILINLAKLGAQFPLTAAGFVGKDLLGEQILADCKRHKIDTKWLRAIATADTSYTDVMTEQKGGHRTFFHYRGANALWKGEEMDFTRTETDRDLVDVAFELRTLGVHSTPVNFLHSIDGTPLERKWDLNPRSCLKALCLFRFANPAVELRVSGGREVNLRSMQAMSLYAANSMFVSDYLTTKGQPAEDDFKMVADLGFQIIIGDHEAHQAWKTSQAAI